MQGYSQVKISQILKLSRTTVNKYLKRDREIREELKEVEAGSVEFHRLSEELAEAPKYRGKGKERKKLKYTPEIDQRIDEILEDERRKDEAYGPSHKLRLTAKQILKILKEEGYDIGYTSVCNAVRHKRERRKETFIKQDYRYGLRAEFDFGERKITIAGEVRKIYMAVIACPASGFRDYYVYLSSGMDVFVDSQVRFFERVGGVYETMVYDNMKNVVAKFVGRNERELTETVVTMSNYYGYQVILTNPYRGNEKGSVESSVKVVMRELFARRDQFDSFDEVVEYVSRSKPELNRETDIEEEKKHLKEYRHPMETAKVTTQRVNKYAFVRVDNNDYSVPEEYTGGLVTVKTYPLTIEIIYKNEVIAKHKRLEGKGGTRVVLSHYYGTMLRKPGALRNSLALKQAPQLKKVFEDHYTDKPREFLQLLIDNKDTLNVEQLEKLLSPESVLESEKSALEERSRDQLSQVLSLFSEDSDE